MSYGYQDILGPKNQTRKVRNIHKDIELRRDLMHNVLCQNVSILPLWILLTIRIDTFWTEVLTVLSGGIRTVWHRKSQTKKLTIFKAELNYD